LLGVQHEAGNQYF